MTFLRADGVSLEYPLFVGSSAGAQSHGADSASDRMVFHANGRPKSVRALTNIDLNFEAGDRVGLLGKNGSGKTTLLHVLAGLLPPDHGAVAYAGRLTSLININLGMQMQATGHRNITLRGLASGMSRDEIERLRPAIAEFSELGQFLDLPVETYSAGMRMRLVFAIATAQNPEILLLDEWLSTGDEGFRAKAAERMKSFADRAAIMVLASHSVPLMLSTCNKAVWLDHGAIRMQGEVGTVIEAYRADAMSSSS